MGRDQEPVELVDTQAKETPTSASPVATTALFPMATDSRTPCALAEERRAQLERRAERLGVRLYAEKPTAYSDRMGAYWRLWRDAGAEKPVGGLTDLFPAGRRPRRP